MITSFPVDHEPQTSGITFPTSCPICEAIIDSAMDCSTPRLCPECRVVLWCQRRDRRDVVLLDVHTSRGAQITDVARVAQSLLSPRATRRVVVNLREVQSLDSSFVAGLLVMRRMLAAADCKLVLCELHPHVHELLQRLNLNTLFEITDREHEGVTAV